MINPFPYILANITRKPRSKVSDLKFPKDSITGFIFRVWELIFWRKDGIRREASVEVGLKNGEKYVTRKFYTIESFVTHIEKVIRLSFSTNYLITSFKEVSRYKKQRLIYAFSVLGLSFLLDSKTHGFFPLMIGAIAYGSGVSATTPFVTTHLDTYFAVSGTNLFQYVNLFRDASDPSTFSQNGVELISVSGLLNAGGSNNSRAYCLINPTSGSLSADFSFLTNAGFSSVYYSGVGQITNPISKVTASLVSVASVTATINVKYANSWIVCTELDDQGGPTVTNGRVIPGLTYSILDSNGPVGTGSQNITWNLSGTGASCYCIIEITGLSVSVFNTSTTWTCPANVISVQGETGGGGGSGGRGHYNGTGGGGGGYAKKNKIKVTPTTVYNVMVGTGGTAIAATTSSDGNDGGTSTFTGDSSETVTATGGHGGYFNDSNTGGAASASGGTGTGDVTYNGGNSGLIPTTNGVSASGGGGSAGSGGDGGSSNTPAVNNISAGGSAGSPDGFAGGTGARASGAAAGDGIGAGAGGGGKSWVLSNSMSSGVGIDGFVILSYSESFKISPFPNHYNS